MLGRVLHQLGQQVSNVLGTMSWHVDRVERNRNHSAIVLNFTNRYPQNFTELDRWAVAFWSLRVGENQQALSISTHTSREVVDSVHERKAVRVSFFGLESIDGFELAVDE